MGKNEIKEKIIDEKITKCILKTSKLPLLK